MLGHCSLSVHKQEFCYWSRICTSGGGDPRVLHVEPVPTKQQAFNIRKNGGASICSSNHDIERVLLDDAVKP